MEELIEISTLEAYEEAIASKSIILFTADWCPDCVFIKPFIGDLVKANPEFKFYSINRDKMLDLCKTLNILGIPSFIAYNKQEEIGRLVSKLRKTRQEIQNFIDQVK
jgi:Thiol-disulfide isomerase and thioredoxins